MVPLRDWLLDVFAPLSHKTAVGDGALSSDSLAPLWVPQSERRRLDSYKVRRAYLGNVARHLLTTATDKQRGDRREYGDAALLVARVRDGVLGDDFTVAVDGADDDLPDEPELPPEPEDPGSGAGPLQRRVFSARRDRWQADATAAVEEWERAWAEQPALRARQEWLRDWWDTEMMPIKKVEAEGDAIGLADAVYVLTWSSKAGRVFCDVYDPDCYFPVLTDTTRGFPDKVHLAWQFETTVDGVVKQFVRRRTWELGPLPEGQEPRRHPWMSADDEPSTVTCYFSDGVWAWEDFGTRRADDLDESKARWEITEDGVEARRLDLGFDFLPIVHQPNTPASKEHFGTSVLDLVAQVLDDVAMGDTNIAAAERLAAGPAIGLSGDKAVPSGPVDSRTGLATGGTMTVAPGVVYQLGPNGRMDVLDLSAGLVALLDAQGRRLDRLSVNARVPAEVLGRVKSSETVSGLAFYLATAPFAAMLAVLRLCRDPKDRLLLKMVQRIAQAAGVLEAGPNPTARVVYGQFLPTDRAALVDEVDKLLRARAISRQTAVALLVAGGVPIDDARAEVSRIEHEDFEGAEKLADATGSEPLAADYLGRDLPEQATVAPPALTLPGDGA